MQKIAKEDVSFKLWKYVVGLIMRVAHISNFREQVMRSYNFDQKENTLELPDHIPKQFFRRY